MSVEIYFRCKYKLVVELVLKMEGDTSVKSIDDHEASEEVTIVNEDKTYCDIIPIIVTEASDKQVIQYRKEERSIPIEIIGTIDEIDENEETFPYPLEIKSNRTSHLIFCSQSGTEHITASDGILFTRHE